jgi:hypothetical protein
VNGAVVRNLTLTTPNWTYWQSSKTTDGVTGIYTVEVAQISALFGAGPFVRIDINE